MALIVVAVLLLSILFHELGHAWARKKYRAPYSEIVIHGFGGYCAGPGHFTRHEQMKISFAGPLINFIFVGIAWLLLKTPGLIPVPGETVSLSQFFLIQFASMMLYVNIFLGGLNLLPILPLDGGRIFESFMSNRNPTIVPKVGMIVAGLAAVWGLTRGDMWMTVLFGFFAYSNWQRVQGVRPQF